MTTKWQRITRTGNDVKEAFCDDGSASSVIVWRIAGRIKSGGKPWNARVTRFSHEIGRIVSVEVIAATRREAEELAEQIKDMTL